MDLKKIFLVLMCLISCGHPPYRGKDLMGADEFVMDSYKIREGKFAVLEMEGKNFEPLSSDLLEEYKDTIQEGDILKIFVYHPSRQDLTQSIEQINSSIGFHVEQNSVVLPDLGRVEVVGLSQEEARAKIQGLYDTQIKDTTVYIAYKDRLERKVELAGLVQLSKCPVDGKIRLFEVLSSAKVPTQANFFKSYVIRNEKLLPVDLQKLIQEGDMSQNIVMRGGDKIYIADPTQSSVMVLGEVGKARVIEIPSGTMTLARAITEAGGIPFTGDKSYIQVIRGHLLHPKIYSLHWQHIVRLPADSLLLIPGDIVYVASTPLAEWNNFVNQILPTVIGFELVTKGLKTIGVNVP